MVGGPRTLACSNLCEDKTGSLAGGAPVIQDFVDKIGADAYRANAAAAVEKAKALI